MAKLSTQPYKGTRDFYPADMRVRQWIFNKLRQCLVTHGYEEYDGPMLEPFELYAAKTSEEIVNEQLYWLVDRGERKLAIRPEMTPTLARMVAAKQNELPKPLRWFSIPNLWRYERPQRGRLREHWQLNVDVFGGTAGAEDLEICTVIAAIMQSFGAKSDGSQYEVRLNHRALTNAIYTDVLKLPEEKHAAVSRWLDAAPKMSRDEFKAGLEKESLDRAQIQTLEAILDAATNPNVNAQNQPVLQNNSVLKDHASFRAIQKLLQDLHQLGLSAVFRFDPSIMRGFQYYTGLVFEVFDKHPENNRALFGGGRYDNLVGLFGGQALPGVGFGMGDVTFRNFLESHGLLPNFTESSGVYVMAMDESLLIDAQKVAAAIRTGLIARGNNTGVMAALTAEKVKKAFVSAEKLRCRYIVFVGSDEAATGRFNMKDTKTQTQHSGTTADLAQAIEQTASL